MVELKNKIVMMEFEFAVLCNPQKNSCPDLLEGMEIYYTFADTYRLNEGRKLLTN
jgi:hypothetical protein